MEHPRGDSAPADRWPWRLVLLALVAAAAAYAPVLDGELQYDDGRVVERAAGIRDLRRVAGEAFARGLIEAERPLTQLTLAVDFAIGDGAPRPFHVTNVILHLAASLAVFVLGRRVARTAGVRHAAWIAASAAAVFSLHPVQSGAVAYVTQRSEVMASLFYVVTLVLLLEAARRGWSAAGAVSVVGALGAYVLALTAKSSAVTAPFAYLLIQLLLVHRAETGRRELARKLAPAVPLLGVALWFTAGTLQMISAGAGHDGGFQVPGLPPGVYALTELRVVLIYLRLLLVPVGQNVDWDVAPSASALEPTTVAAALVLLAIVGGGAWRWWRVRSDDGPEAGSTRLAVFGLAWFFTLLAPTSTVIPLADVLVEHRLYLAGWGIFLAAAAMAWRFLARLDEARARKVGLAVGLSLAAVLGAALVVRAGLWATRYALWSDAVAKSPGKARPRAQLAFALQGMGRVQDAIEAYQQALARLRPNELEMELQARRNFSALLAEVGRAEEAVAVLRRATELAPGNAEITTNMALALLLRGDLDAAADWVERALTLDPRLPEAHGLRGSVLLRRGDAIRAVDSLQQAVALAPNSGGLLYNLGIALERSGRVAEACSAWGRIGRLRNAPALSLRVARKFEATCR